MLTQRNLGSGSSSSFPKMIRDDSSGFGGRPCRWFLQGPEELDPIFIEPESLEGPDLLGMFGEDVDLDGLEARFPRPFFEGLQECMGDSAAPIRILDEDVVQLRDLAVLVEL